MGRFLRTTLILLSPILLMIGVNEVSKIAIPIHDHKNYGMATLNPAEKIEEKCSWTCHNDTGFCKSHHVKFNPKFFSFTDPLYFGMIAGLRGFGNYGLANIFLLVLFLPLLIYTLFIKSLNIQDRINQLKKS